MDTTYHVCMYYTHSHVLCEHTHTHTHTHAHTLPEECNYYYLQQTLSHLQGVVANKRATPCTVINTLHDLSYQGGLNHTC